MKHFIPLLAVAAFLSSASLAYAVDDLPVTSPENHEPIKATVIDSTPSNYTIDVHSFRNLGADTGAPTFAVYTSSRLPELCGDFSDTPLTYQKPEKYKRVFDLSDSPEILAAINEYQCVVIPNKPDRNAG